MEGKLREQNDFTWDEFEQNGSASPVNQFTWNDFEDPKVASLTQIKKMRLAILHNINDDSKDDVFELLLDEARDIYLELVYPFNHTIQDLPDFRARNWQTRCAIELYNIDSNGNVKSYSENGLSESYAKAGLSPDLLAALPPAHGGVPIDG